MEADIESDISSSESVDEEIKLKKNFIELLNKIDANKYSYDDYVLLVDIAQWDFFFWVTCCNLF